jgi:hypothetical protein
MPLWHLLPLDRTSDHWHASTYQGEVIVRAASEAQARSTAATAFSRAYPRTPKLRHDLLYASASFPRLVLAR